MFPSIDPGEVGTTGLIWLFASYGFILFQGANFISEGSDLLLLVPSLAGLVGGVVLPLLGAIPDGAIMLFSGLGDIESAQETLSVGVGALAGSTIMLLTIPWGLSVLAGRVDIVPTLSGMRPNYTRKPKLTKGMDVAQELNETGVTISKEVKHGSRIMILTTIPYFIIQIPASFLRKKSADEIVQGEKYWALFGLVVCLFGFVSYLLVHIKASKEDEEKFRRTEVIKKLLSDGTVSLSGAFSSLISTFDHPQSQSNDLYKSISSADFTPSEKTYDYLSSVLKEPFRKYDTNGNGSLDPNELHIFFRDFNEHVSDEEVEKLFSKFDTNKDGTINFREFVMACYTFIVIGNNTQHDFEVDDETRNFAASFAGASNGSQGDDEEEEEEMPKEIADLPPEEQEQAIKRRAFKMLALGTLLVFVFSDPMVDVMQEIAFRINISPFYVSFILAPLASNASEVLASQYYASKKTSNTISVSFAALQGAACMNNTFCLSIFMGLIFFRGLAWQYTAETVTIVLVQIFIWFMTAADYMTLGQGVVILSLFPLSIALIAFLEAIGFD